LSDEFKGCFFFLAPAAEEADPERLEEERLVVGVGRSEGVEVESRSVEAVEDSDTSTWAGKGEEDGVGMREEVSQRSRQSGWDDCRVRVGRASGDRSKGWGDDGVDEQFLIPSTSSTSPSYVHWIHIGVNQSTLRSRTIMASISAERGSA
jgi:hypothetical protein